MAHWASTRKLDLLMFTKVVERSQGTILDFILKRDFILRRDAQQETRAQNQPANNCIQLICQRLAYLGTTPSRIQTRIIDWILHLSSARQLTASLVEHPLTSSSYTDICIAPSPAEKLLRSSLRTTPRSNKQGCRLVFTPL